MDGVAAAPRGQAPGRALAAGLLELRLICVAPGPGPRSLVKRVPSAPQMQVRAIPKLEVPERGCLHCSRRRLIALFDHHVISATPSC